MLFHCSKPALAGLRAISVLLPLVLAACTDERYEQAGTPVDQARPTHTLAPANDRQVLFGDLHVHTTFSIDAFEQSLSFVGGEGAHPPADACDFARYCSQLDFWSINDHATAITPDRWMETKAGIRACNAVTGDNPDTVAFVGWEWTQIGNMPADHYGHKNVLFPGLAEQELPPRPVSAAGDNTEFLVPMDMLGILSAPLWGALFDSGHRRDHLRFLQYMAATFSAPACDPALSAKELPGGCTESAQTPAELFARLDRVSDDYLVIPHGNSWGLYTPPGSSWQKQLAGDMHNDQRQTLLEVYSGHGNSEEYRSWRAVAYTAAGQPYCPEPHDGYLPCCWQAGEIVRSQCERLGAGNCEQQATQARDNAVAAGASAHLTLPGVSQEEWLNCGVCEDCFLPAYDFRPGVSAQAALVQGDFSSGQPRHFRFGFIASSDNHSARPGTGYKETNRRQNIDFVAIRPQPGLEEPAGEVVSIAPGQALATMNTLFNRERASSMLYTGGLAAVHSDGRTRGQIWDALKRNEVYGTSGPRIMLWFDHIDAAGVTSPMGSELRTAAEPQFRVRTMGALRQLPGCPNWASQALGDAKAQRLCGNECYNPSDERVPMSRIEVIRVRPQLAENEPLASLIDDPWKVIDCAPGRADCEAIFTDPEYAGASREYAYYVRAVQTATDTINGGGLRCDYDESGRCKAVSLCYGHNKTDLSDDCLASVEHRAWSSPIYLLPR